MDLIDMNVDDLCRTVQERHTISPRHKTRYRHLTNALQNYQQLLQKLPRVWAFQSEEGGWVQVPFVPGIGDCAYIVSQEDDARWEHVDWVKAGIYRVEVVRCDRCEEEEAMWGVLPDNHSVDLEFWSGPLYLDRPAAVKADHMFEQVHKDRDDDVD